MAGYDYIVEVGTEYLTDLEVHDASVPLCDNIKDRFINYFNERIFAHYPDWDIFSHDTTMIGNHFVITLLLRRPKQ